MSICSCFCIVGFIVLLFDDPKKYNCESLSEEMELETLEAGLPHAEMERNIKASFTLLGCGFVLLGMFNSQPS